METPFTNAAKRGEVFMEEPMIEDFPSQIPSCPRYSRQIDPVCARDPASARPKPSRMDFLSSSMTPSAISSYLIAATNYENIHQGVIKIGNKSILNGLGLSLE